MQTLKKNMVHPKCRICDMDYKSYNNGAQFYPGCLCEEEDDHEKIKRKKRIKAMFTDCKIDKFFLDSDFKVHSKELQPYYDSLEWLGKKSLFIYGNYGCHKTGQVTAICKKVIENDVSVRYYRTSEIVYQRDYETIKKIKLLVLDNFGKNIKFEDSRNVLFDLLDYRLHNYLSTIIVTNELLKDKIDGALYDRLAMFEKIIISGGSTRGKQEIK